MCDRYDDEGMDSDTPSTQEMRKLRLKVKASQAGQVVSSGNQGRQRNFGFNNGISWHALFYVIIFPESDSESGEWEDIPTPDKDNADTEVMENNYEDGDLKVGFCDLFRNS